MVRGKVQQEEVTPKAGVRNTSTRKMELLKKKTESGKSSLGGKSSILPSCNGCGILTTDEVKALQCDKCQSNLSWKCIECVNVKGATYDDIIHWEFK